MPLAIQPFVVDAPRLRAAAGSKDTALLDRILRNTETGHFLRSNRLLVSDDPGVPPLEEVIADLIMGDTRYPSAPAQYGYAYQVLCYAFTCTPDEPSFQVDHAALAAVDAAVREAAVPSARSCAEVFPLEDLAEASGITVKADEAWGQPFGPPDAGIWDLVHRSPLVKLPPDPVVDFPFTGHLTFDEMMAQFCATPKDWSQRDWDPALRQTVGDFYKLASGFWQLMDHFVWTELTETSPPSQLLRRYVCVGFLF